MSNQTIIQDAPTDDILSIFARNNPEILDWMRHSQMLANQRLAMEKKIAKKHPERADWQWWAYQAAWENIVIHAVLTGELNEKRSEFYAWHQYMVNHAMLQVKRYAREISEPDFRNQCRELREQRQTKLKAIYAKNGDVA